MKVELTLPALERLIGGDSEIEVGLRTQIVEAFAEKHLRKLLNDAMFKAASAIWEADVDRIVKAKIQEVLAEKQAKMEADPDGAVRYKFHLDTAIENAVNAKADAQCERWRLFFSTDMKRMVEHAVKRDIDKEVDREIQRRLEALRVTK